MAGTYADRDIDSLHAELETRVRNLLAKARGVAPGAQPLPGEQQVTAPEAEPERAPTAPTTTLADARRQAARAALGQV